MISHSLPWITDQDYTAVKQVLESGIIAQGAKVREFEKALAQYTGALDAVACGSGTAALLLALLALNVGKGDEVILPTYTCHSVSDAVKVTGASPILCDVGKHWNMTYETVAQKVSPRTKAIIVVHIFGISADTASFLDFGLPIIEDCCQTLGGKHHGGAGTIGTFGVYSFHATKCLATGEGGAVTSEKTELIEKIRRIKDANIVPSLMTDIQAALGLSQLSRYDEFIRRRLSLANRYIDRLPDHLISTIKSIKDRSIFFRFPLRFSGGMKFEEIQQKFAKQEIVVRHGVDELLHRKCGLPDDEFPEAVMTFNETVSIPIYPRLTQEQQLRIIEQTRVILAGDSF